MDLLVEFWNHLLVYQLFKMVAGFINYFLGLKLAQWKPTNEITKIERRFSFVQKVWCIAWTSIMDINNIGAHSVILLFGRKATWTNIREILAWKTSTNECFVLSVQILALIWMFIRTRYIIKLNSSALYVSRISQG